MASQRIDTITENRQFKYVYFKKPLTRNVKWLGMNLWKMSRKGFWLDILEERAKEEIKAKRS